MSAPLNKLLSKSDRALLTEFAGTHIKCIEEQLAFDENYSKAKPIVLEVVRVLFPLNDMAVLARYNLVQPDKCIRFGGWRNNDTSFVFKDDDPDMPFVPKFGSCYNRAYIWTKDHLQILSAYQLSRQALALAKGQKLETYRRLILGARSFNDVSSIWPAAEKLRNSIIPSTLE